jgi:DNA repair protein RadA/Sms
VAAALISSLANAPLPSDTVFFGEISLAGGVRPVVHAALRLREAGKLGFARAQTGRLNAADRQSGLEVSEFGQLAELVGRIAARGRGRAPDAEP